MTESIPLRKPPDEVVEEYDIEKKRVIKRGSSGINDN